MRLNLAFIRTDAWVTCYYKATHLRGLQVFKKYLVFITNDQDVVRIGTCAKTAFYFSNSLEELV